jgi:hypothetical protein
MAAARPSLRAAPMRCNTPVVSFFKFSGKSIIRPTLCASFQARMTRLLKIRQIIVME